MGFCRGPVFLRFSSFDRVVTIVCAFIKGFRIGPNPISLRSILGAGLAVALMLGVQPSPAKADLKNLSHQSSIKFAPKSLDRARLPGKSNVYSLWQLEKPEPKVIAPGMKDPVSCLAMNIYFEARNEPYEGKVAVSHVVLNRVASSRFPSSICGVIREGGQKKKHACQFSWFCDGLEDIPKNRRAWKESVSIAKKVYDGKTKDPSRGAMWYHADYVSPDWRNDYPRLAKIGTHIFYGYGKSAASKKIVRNSIYN